MEWTENLKGTILALGRLLPGLHHEVMAEVTPMISLDERIPQLEGTVVEPVAVLVKDDVLILEKAHSEPLKAGSTLPRSQQEQTSCTWSDCPSSRFNLRVGPDYARNKHKAPSPAAMMNVVGVE